VETVARVADALAYAHGRGILHRDVKPGNILLEADGTPRLTDFGLALDLRAPGLTVAGEVFGSPQYMSPEQAVRREAPIDERTDVYSLAVTLYELLTLRLPYDATTSVELLTALTAGKVVPPRKANPEIPERIEGVLLRALAKDPRDRHESATAFAADLRAALTGEPAAAPTRRGRPGRRRLKVLVVAAAVVLVLVVATVLFDPGDAPYTLPGVYLPSDVIAALADRQASNGAEILAECVRPEVRIRRVLSRSDLGYYHCIVSYGISEVGGPGGAFVFVARWEVSVDGSPWRPIGDSWMGYSITARNDPDTVSATNHSIAASPLLDAVLGDSSSGDSVNLRHRVTFRVARRPDGWTGPEKHLLETGTAWTWTGEPRDHLIYDEYPADYPEPVSGPEIDRRMRAALTPVLAEYTGVQVGDDGVRFLGLLLHYSGDGGPIPAACLVELRVPGEDRLVGTTGATFDPAEESEPPGTVDRTSIIGTPVLLPEVPDKEEAALLLGLDSGKVTRLRLVFRPSRDQALGQPHYDRYWGGTLDVEVPVTRGAEGGLDNRFR
jgi:hypothetical protein